MNFTHAVLTIVYYYSIMSSKMFSNLVDKIIAIIAYYIIASDIIVNFCTIIVNIAYV